MKVHFTAGLFLLVITSFSSYGQGTVVVADPTKPDKETKLSDKMQSLVDREAMPKFRAKYENDACTVEPEPAGFANGAFTRPGAAQTLAFYQICQTGNGFGVVGVVVIENGKVTGLYGSDSGWSVDIGALQDINGDGLDEFTLSFSGGMHQGQGGVGVDIMQFASGVPKGLGWFKAEEFMPDAPTAVWKVTAKPGKTPVYYKQKYVSRDEKKWRPLGKNVAFKLTKATSKFEVVK